MKIWVDADACPVVIKEILYRAANRTQIPLTLVANQMLRVPPSPWIRALQVPGGFDVADQRIAAEAEAGTWSSPPISPSPPRSSPRARRSSIRGANC